MKVGFETSHFGDEQLELEPGALSLSRQLDHQSVSHDGDFTKENECREASV